ncbi:MAG: preprotein translocase subunit YajC [Gemmatimonadaceae bacterium]|nr:preprotein translocase subunit YajC [Gemmatimonadaceae bacterium]
MTYAYPILAIALQLPSNGLIGPIFMYGAIFAIFYFILIRPQQKQRKTQDALIRSVKRGDEIVTAGGIVGEVIHIRDSAAEGGASVPLEDRITIKSGESRLVIERGRIARVVRSSGTSTPTQG